AQAYHIAKRFYELGFQLNATEGTTKYLLNKNLPVRAVGKIGTDEKNVVTIMQNGEVQFVVNTLTSGKKPRSDGFRIRREAVEHGIISLTNLDTAEAILHVIDSATFRARLITEKGALEA